VGMSHQQRAKTEDLLQNRFLHKGCRWAVKYNLTIAQGHNPVTEERGRVDIVCDRKDGHLPLGVDLFQKALDFFAVAEIQEGGGLIEEQDRSLLRKNRGQHDPLPFPAAESSHDAMPKTPCAC